LTFYLAFYLTYVLAFYLACSGIRECPAIWQAPLKSGSAHCDLAVAAEARQCPLRSGARGSSPAVPTALWSWQMKSGSAHCDPELADEVRQCPLRSGAGEEEKKEEEKKEEEEAAGSSDKIYQPSPGR